MLDVINLALPYFGLILIGFACGKWKKIPESGMAWMNFFILYVTLPALFFRILARTPLEQLNNLPFVIATTAATAAAFVLAAGLSLAIRRASESAVIAGVAGGYGNIGYMGPGLALAALGQGAAVPVALIFCFDNIFLFSITPLLMALIRAEQPTWGHTAAHIVGRIASNPLIVSSAVGAAAAAFQIHLPPAADKLLEFLQGAAAPAALFTLGVTVGMRPMGRAGADVLSSVAVKLAVHPTLVALALYALGPFDPVWIGTAVLMAALPPALNVFVMARQFDTWIEGASSAVLVGTLLSVGTLTTVIWAIGTGVLSPLAGR